MVHYSGLTHLRGGSSAKSKDSRSPSLRGTNTSMASSSGSAISSFSDALTDDATQQSNDPYFHFSSDQQDALLEDARSTATALIVDTLSGLDKWRFLTMTSNVQLFELKSDASDRVSAMRSDDPQQSPAPASQSHTLLAITRVRAKLDDFMRIAATDKRDKFQNFLACLHDNELQHADVFTAFGSLGTANSTANSNNSSSADVLSSSFTSTSSFESSRNTRSSSGDAEQYAIKYYSLKAPRASKASSARNGMASKLMGRAAGKTKAFATRSGTNNSSTGSTGSSDGLTLCVGEYATIRQGKIRTSAAVKAGSGHSALDDHRIGIIASHSVEDPQVTRYCKPIASTTAGSSTSSGFAVTSRSFAQFSGLVVYPVESSVPGESVLEVVIKLSCFDARGISALKKQAMMTFLVAHRKLESALLVLRLHDSRFLSAANWTKNELRKCCNVCQQSFPSFRRKHHCRLCGEVICSKCSSVHAIKLAKTGKCAFRICSACLHGVGSGGSSSSSGHHHHQQQQQLKRLDDSSPEDDDDDEEVVEVDSQLEPIVRPSPVSTPSPQRREQDASPQHQTLLHKQQLEQHDSRHGVAKPSASSHHQQSTDKLRAASTESSNASECNDPRGFLSSNVTVTTAASTPPSATPSPLGSPVASPIASAAPFNVFGSSSSNGSGSDSRGAGAPDFIDRASEMSVRDFHDSEFALDLTDLHLDTARQQSMVFAIDEDLEDLDDVDDDDDDVVAPLATRSGPTATAFHVGGYERLDDDDDDDDDTGFEFHDSEVGINFHLDDLEEFNDAKYEALEEIQEISTTSRNQRHRLLDELRCARLMDYGILDSGRDASFDIIATQAAQFLGCGLASVSFVDDRREFVKAAAGDFLLPMPSSHSNNASSASRPLHEIPIEHSLAAHIVQRCAADDALRVVQSLDASRDDALAANAFVLGAPFVRFVVGVPVRTRDGVVLGALVVADARPRRRALSPSETNVLLDFAEQLTDLLHERWQARLYEHRAAPAPAQIQQTLQSLLSQSYHTGQQLRMQQHMPLTSSRYHQRGPSHNVHSHSRYMSPPVSAARESVHGRLTMQGIEL